MNKNFAQGILFWIIAYKLMVVYACIAAILGLSYSQMMAILIVLVLIHPGQVLIENIHFAWKNRKLNKELDLMRNEALFK